MLFAGRDKVKQLTDIVEGWKDDIPVNDCHSCEESALISVG